MKQRMMRCVPHQSTVSAQDLETPPDLGLGLRQPDARGQSDRGDVEDHTMLKEVTDLVEALKHIKTLARAAKDSDDAAVLRKNFEMILTLVDKALPRTRKGIR